MEGSQSLPRLRAQATMIWDASPRRPAGLVCARSAPGSCTDPFRNHVPKFGPAHPCLAARDQKAGGWATDLALSLSVYPCMVSLEASKLVQSCTRETVTLVREIRVRHAKDGLTV